MNKNIWNPIPEKDIELVIEFCFASLYQEHDTESIRQNFRFSSESDLLTEIGIDPVLQAGFNPIHVDDITCDMVMTDCERKKAFKIELSDGKPVFVIELSQPST